MPGKKVPNYVVLNKYVRIFFLIYMVFDHFKRCCHFICPFILTCHIFFLFFSFECFSTLLNRDCRFHWLCFTPDTCSNVLRDTTAPSQLSLRIWSPLLKKLITIRARIYRLIFDVRKLHFLSGHRFTLHHCLLQITTRYS